jgi:hypothetical protein
MWDLLRGPGHSRPLHARRNDRQQLVRKALQRTGKTVDNVLPLDIVTDDGFRMTVGPTSPSGMRISSTWTFGRSEPYCGRVPRQGYHTVLLGHLTSGELP